MIDHEGHGTDCEVCHGYGNPSPRIPPEREVTVRVNTDDSITWAEEHVIQNATKHLLDHYHSVYEAIGGLRYAPEEIQKRWRDAFDENMAEIVRGEDEKWMRLVQEKFGLPPIPPIKPKVIVREIDHSSVYCAIDGVVPETGKSILMTNQVQPSRNGIYIVGGAVSQGRSLVAEAKLVEAKRHESRSRVGNAVPTSKSKVMNRKKAKAAKKARKAGRHV